MIELLTGDEVFHFILKSLSKGPFSHKMAGKLRRKKQQILPHAFSCSLVVSLGPRYIDGK